jgi:hypothetical protein
MRDAVPIAHTSGRDDPLRPLAVGTPVGHPAGTRGTLGAFVRWAGDPDKVAILSAATAIAPLPARQGDWVHRMSDDPGAILTGFTRIGQLRVFSRLAPETGGALDAAVATLDSDMPYLSNKVPVIGRPGSVAVLGAVLHQVELEPGTEVAMVGAVSGFRRGIVVTTMMTNVPALAFGKAVTLAETIEIASAAEGPFSQAGDAGALVYRLADCRPIGLVSARQTGEQPATYAVPLGLICDHLELQLLPG